MLHLSSIFIFSFFVLGSGTAQALTSDEYLAALRKSAQQANEEHRSCHGLPGKAWNQCYAGATARSEERRLELNRAREATQAREAEQRDSLARAKQNADDAALSIARQNGKVGQKGKNTVDDAAKRAATVGKSLREIHGNGTKELDGLARSITIDPPRAAPSRTSPPVGATAKSTGHWGELMGSPTGRPAPPDSTFTQPQRNNLRSLEETVRALEVDVTKSRQQRERVEKRLETEQRQTRAQQATRARTTRPVVAPTVVPQRGVVKDSRCYTKGCGIN